MTNLKLSTQALAVIANFIIIEAWSFFAHFERNLSFATICSQKFRPYSKFEYGYWFDWILILEDLNIGRKEIEICFGNGWVESGDDKISNAQNRQELSVTIDEVWFWQDGVLAVTVSNPMVTKKLIIARFRHLQRSI